MLESVYRLDFEIELLTGLHIGGSIKEVFL